MSEIQTEPTTVTPRFLVTDTETSGLHADKHQLLSIYAATTGPGPEFKIYSRINIFIKHDNYVLAPEAFNTNKIDQLKLNEQGAVDLDTAKSLFGTWLHNQMQHLFEPVVNGSITTHEIPKEKKLIGIGHNYPFDFNFITKQLMTAEQWGMYVSHHYLDTAVLAFAEKLKGNIPAEISVSLQSLISHAGIIAGTAHTAQADALATLEVLKWLLKLAPAAAALL